MDNGEQKPGVEKRITFLFFKSWVDSFCFYVFLVSLFFLIFFSWLCLILNKSWFFWLAEVFPYWIAIAVSLQGLTKRSCQGLPQDGSGCITRQGAEGGKEVGGSCFILWNLNLVWYKLNLRKLLGKIIARSPENGVFLFGNSQQMRFGNDSSWPTNSDSE